ncbi:hypothetical protein HYC85_002977 [Camellia sinensis]|uniref:Uncharacterized protein n=1 Tax=Camellia sinensis TaxID=4442 RepID=A0A7J7IC28_CAMSI|nr:hypothetical protein HYC85_002977 [Camellia sinensis]
MGHYSDSFLLAARRGMKTTRKRAQRKEATGLTPLGYLSGRNRGAEPAMSGI